VRDDGGRIEGMAPTSAVDYESDATDPDVTWVALQTRCTCGTRAGRVIEIRQAHAQAQAQ